MKRKPLLFLKDILNAIERIETYTCNGKEAFLNSSSLQDATLFRLQTIGEAVNQLPNELKEKHSEIPWRQIVGFRNLLAHVYWQVDLNTVWTILEAEGELQSLKAVVIELIRDLS
ncbi:MAG: DUF86 domain-containing protein [Xenococcus sp. MO_188.B8]|nr:DUF86 domain-containing protein [Xenococcus sp. MO_188.B8]